MLYRFLLLTLLIGFPSVIAAQDYTIITPENAHELEYVAKLGRGIVFDIEFTDTNTFEISNDFGDRWQYDVNNMDAPAIFQPAPISDLDTENVFSFNPLNYTNDRQWHIRHEGVWSLEPHVQVVSFVGYASVRKHVMTSNYLVVWRSGYRTDENTQCNQEQPCPNHIIIINMFTKEIYGELFLDDVVDIDIALNGTHVAVISEKTTEFYSLFNPNRLDYGFTIPARIKQFSGDGRFGITSEWEDIHLYVWNLETQTQQLHLQYQAGERTWGYQLSHDGRRLAVMTNITPYVDSSNRYDYSEKNIGIWDTQTGQRLTIIPSYTTRSTMQFSRDGHYFAIFTQQQVFYDVRTGIYFISLYQSDTGRQIAQVDNGNLHPASTMVFTEDSSLLVVVFSNGRIVLFDTTSGLIVVDKQGYNGAEHLTFLGDDMIFTTSYMGESYGWDANTFQPSNAACPIVAISTDEHTALCDQQWKYNVELQGYESFPATLLNLTTYEEVDLKYEHIPDASSITAIYSPDNNYMITVGMTVEKAPLIWKRNSNTYEPMMFLETSYPYYIRGFQFLGDGQYVASRSHGEIWDTETFEPVVQLPVSADINSLGFYSEAGDWAAFHDESDKIFVWRLSDLLAESATDPILILENYNNARVAGSPDGRLMIVNSGTTTEIFETATFTQLYQYRAEGNEIKFSPDGRYIIHAGGQCMGCGEGWGSNNEGAQVWAIPNS